MFKVVTLGTPEALFAFPSGWPTAAAFRDREMGVGDLRVQCCVYAAKQSTNPPLPWGAFPASSAASRKCPARLGLVKVLWSENLGALNDCRYGQSKKQKRGF